MALAITLSASLVTLALWLGGPSMYSGGMLSLAVVGGLLQYLFGTSYEVDAAGVRRHNWPLAYYCAWADVVRVRRPNALERIISWFDGLRAADLVVLERRRSGPRADSDSLVLFLRGPDRERLLQLVRERASHAAIDVQT